jgi:ribonuclease R
MAKKKTKKENKNHPQSFNARTLKKYILEILKNNPTLNYNYKQISKKLNIKDDGTKHLISRVFKELKSDGFVEEISTGKYKFKIKTGYKTGKLDISKKNNAIVYVEDSDEEIFIPEANLHHSLHGDLVEVYVYAKRKKSHQLEGEIVRIVERGRDQFVGTVEVSRNFAFLIIEHRYMPYDIFIPSNKLHGAKQGEKAIAKIIEWPDGAKSPIGEIIEILGKSGENEVEMHAILAEFDLPYKFTEEVEKEAEKISAEITKEEIDRRRDFRNITTFTIDPADAKDFDDALSLKILENGNYEVGVHIADVTHYIKEETILEEEAEKRATSVYLVDRVVPMLPEKLSNGVCSLSAHTDKLTYSAVFEIDKDVNIINSWFGRTIINSDRRFSYEEAQKVIETGEGDLKNEILTLHDLAQKLRNQRFKKGAISFDRIEVKFILDEKGKPTGVYFKEAKASNQLIEEFMLLANKKVAELIGKVEKGEQAKTFVYRIHDEPDLEKLGNFSKFISKFGYSIDIENEEKIANSLNLLLANIKGKPFEEVISNLAIRSMAKAVYSTKNIGHYGLGFKHYTHFTSPIRRYPDMMVHRLLDRYLQNGTSVLQHKYEKKCKHSSDMENIAVQAERASIKYKSVEFMKDKIGQEFSGVISGLTEWGMYVEIVDTKIEGMVSLKELDDDFYSFDEKNYCLIGHYNERKFTLGDSVRVTILRANVEKRQLDFKLLL